MQGVARNCVRLLPHDPAWAEEFNTVKAELLTMHGENAVRIEHIGSTAIVGIYAKPILDILLVVRSMDRLDKEAMTAVGYDDRGMQPPELTRRLFVLRSNDDLSLRHIHCCTDGEPEIERYLAFRDYLNAHPEDAKAYEALKKTLAERFADDRPSYTAGKHAFITEICSRAKTSTAQRSV